MTYEEIRTRIYQIRQRITDASKKSGRDPSQIRVLGASKQVSGERVLEAIRLGINDIGENQVQEAETKFHDSKIVEMEKTKLHFIGNLQTNKVKRAVALFDTIQSVDSIQLVTRIDRAAEELNKQISVYIQVNVGSESTKLGINPQDIMKLVEPISLSKNVRLEGLMTVPPHLENPDKLRPYFTMLRNLRDSISAMNPYKTTRLELSMGMTEDFEVAIEEGATMVRLGSAIWGTRPK